MRHHDRAFAEFHKFREDLFDRRRVNDHIIPYARKLLDLIWDRFFRVYKRGKAVYDLSVFYLYRTDLYDLTGIRT